MHSLDSREYEKTNLTVVAKKWVGRLHVLQIPQMHELLIWSRFWHSLFIFDDIAFCCWYMIHNTTNIRIGSITVIVDVIDVVVVVVAFEVMHS